MKRYSKKEKVGYSIASRQYVSYHLAVKKLGQIEDLEENLGIELLDLIDNSRIFIEFYTIEELGKGRKTIRDSLGKVGKYNNEYCLYDGILVYTPKELGNDWFMSYEEAEEKLKELG